jgi:hypothetical protein
MRAQERGGKRLDGALGRRRTSLMRGNDRSHDSRDDDSEDDLNRRLVALFSTASVSAAYAPRPSPGDGSRRTKPAFSNRSVRRLMPLCVSTTGYSARAEPAQPRASEIEARVLAESPKRTRIEFERRHLKR